VGAAAHALRAAEGALEGSFDGAGGQPRARVHVPRRDAADLAGGDASSSCCRTS
jgi:hypothetical protein